MAKKKVKQNTGPPPLTAVAISPRPDPDGSVLIQTVGMLVRGYNEIAAISNLNEINNDLETLKCIGREVYRKGTKLTHDVLYIIGDERVPVKHVFKLMTTRKGDKYIPIDLDCIMVVKSGPPIESPVDHKMYEYDPRFNEWVCVDNKEERRHANNRENNSRNRSQESVNERRSRLANLRSKRREARQGHCTGSDGGFGTDALD